MRILQMTDFHGSERALRASRELIQEHTPDLFLVTGDITDFGPLEYASALFRDLGVKALAIPGNCDPRSILGVLEDMKINLHGRRVSFRGQTIVGLGGSTPTPFGTPFELREEEMRAALAPLMEAGVVLATHSPPYGRVDVVPGAGHAGSKVVAALAEEFKPRVVLCGHIHEARGVEKGPVPCVNPGPAFSGYGALVDLGEDVQVTLLP